MLVQYIDNAGHALKSCCSDSTPQRRQPATARFVPVDYSVIRGHQISNSVDSQSGLLMGCSEVTWRERDVHLIHRRGKEALKKSNTTLHIGDYGQESSARPDESRKRGDTGTRVGEVLHEAHRNDQICVVNHRGGRIEDVATNHLAGKSTETLVQLLATHVRIVNTYDAVTEVGKVRKYRRICGSCFEDDTVGRNAGQGDVEQLRKFAVAQMSGATSPGIEGIGCWKLTPHLIPVLLSGLVHSRSRLGGSALRGKTARTNSASMFAHYTSYHLLSKCCAATSVNFPVVPKQAMRPEILAQWTAPK
jgi:hypothetical protein